MNLDFETSREGNRIFRLASISLYAIVLAQLFSCGNRNDQSIKLEIEKYLQTEMKKQQIPGLTYAVVFDNKIIDSGALGVGNVEYKVPTTIHSQFNIGSIGKTFTATSIMLLQKDGKLSVNDPINKYLDSLPDSWKHITIKHLLSHTSGIRDYCQDFPGYPLLGGETGEGLEARKGEVIESQFIKSAASEPLNFTPGERWAYCNSNFFLLGFIVHKVSGKSLSEFMNERIFTPLGMKETRRENVPEIIPNRVSGYMLNDDNTLIHGAYISNFYSTQGDMGIITTATDMAKWSMALDEGIILDKETLQQMWTLSKLSNGLESMVFFGSSSYGLGWDINNYHGIVEIGHSGSFMNGYTANFARFPEKHLAVIVLTNLNPTNVARISYKIAGFYVPELKPIAELQPEANADSSLNKKVYDFLTGYHRGNFDTSEATLNFNQRINPIVKILNEQNELKSQAKLQVNCIKTDRMVDQNLVCWGVPVSKINYYKIIMRKDTSYVAIYFTSDNKIADIGWD